MDVNEALAAGGLPTIGPGGAGSGSSPSPAPAASLPPGASAPPATAEPTPGGPIIAGLGAPVDGLLSEDDASAAASGTLFVTDLVFANPNGREGALILLRDGDELIRLKLENFRDLDYHFVTPIVLTDGQALNLSLACTGENASPCDPTVFYSGYTRP